MGQTRETGRRGHESGYRNADVLAKRLNAQRVSTQSNEFVMGSRRVLLKTGDRGAVASGLTLAGGALSSSSPVTSAPMALPPRVRVTRVATYCS
jgi:hypothetical protein